MTDDVAAHNQAITHHYVVRYPDHSPRKDDPHLADFMEFKRRRKKTNTWHCDFAQAHRNGDTSECDLSKPLEAHHKIIELAMLNEIDFALLEKDFPGISAHTVGKWIDTDANLTLLCIAHHRGHMGVHVASASDWTAQAYIRGLIA